MGAVIANELGEQKIPFIVIEKNEEKTVCESMKEEDCEMSENCDNFKESSCEDNVEINNEMNEFLFHPYHYHTHSPCLYLHFLFDYFDLQ